MHAIVVVKQVPDTTNVRINMETGTLIREGVPAILNPYDAHALEAALRLKEQFGGKVTVLTMGPLYEPGWEVPVELLESVPVREAATRVAQIKSRAGL